MMRLPTQPPTYYSYATLSTLDGITFDESSVPDFPDFGLGENCLVASGDDTLFNVGSSSGGKEVLRHTKGDAEWERLADTNLDKEATACGIVRRQAGLRLSKSL